MNCPKHAMCHCILKQTCYSNGFQDALRKVLILIKTAGINPSFEKLSVYDAMKILSEDLRIIKEDKRD